MMTPITEFSKILLETIARKDALATLNLIQEFKAAMGTDAEYVMWITTPANLSELQGMITTHLNIPHRQMMIARPRPGCTRSLRGSLFLQAMENSIKRLV